jgi:hypothetical protein
MTIVRYVCVADNCSFCSDTDDEFESHAASLGERHDALKIEYDTYYKKAKVTLIDNNNIQVSS